MKKFYGIILALSACTLGACGKSQMQIWSKPPASASTSVTSANVNPTLDDLRKNGDELQDKSLAALLALGASPLSQYPAEYKNNPEDFDLAYLGTSAMDGQTYVAANENSIKTTFVKLVNATSDFQTSPTEQNKKLYENYLNMMQHLGSYLQEILSTKSDNDVANAYKHGMNEYYNMLWLKYCVVWSGSDHSSCLADPIDRAREIEIHQKNFETLKAQYQDKLDALITADKAEIDNKNAIQKLSGIR